MFKVARRSGRTVSNFTEYKNEVGTYLNSDLNVELLKHRVVPIYIVIGSVHGRAVEPIMVCTRVRQETNTTS